MKPTREKLIEAIKYIDVVIGHTDINSMLAIVNSSVVIKEICGEILCQEKCESSINRDAINKGENNE